MPRGNKHSDLLAALADTITNPQHQYIMRPPPGGGRVVSIRMRDPVFDTVVSLQTRSGWTRQQVIDSLIDRGLRDLNKLLPAGVPDKSRPPPVLTWPPHARERVQAMVADGVAYGVMKRELIQRFGLKEENAYWMIKTARETQREAARDAGKAVRKALNRS